MEFSTLSVVILGVAVLLSNGNAQSPTPSPDFDCPYFDRDTIHPHPTDCVLYYVCTNGLAWLESCPPGLLFDPLLLECNWPWLVDCNSVTVTTPPTTTPMPTTQPTSTTAPDTSTSPPDSTTSAPDTTTSGPQTSTSEAPASSTTTMPDSTTTAPTTTGLPDSTTSVVPTTTGLPDSTTAAPTTTPPSDGFRCPSPDGYFPHPDLCEAYYVCEANLSTLNYCPPGLHFDPILTVCNWPDQVNCSRGRHF